MKVAGKVIVITGAGSGMGREIALELVRRGARVAALSIRTLRRIRLDGVRGGDHSVDGHSAALF